jgi:hypothetical protein
LFGRAINPMLVRGQIVGEFTQGLGGALMEEFRYSERGDPLAVTFADYLMPTSRETPQVEIILTEDFPTDLNPLGIKGAGESGITGVGAAIASAVMPPSECPAPSPRCRSRRRGSRTSWRGEGDRLAAPRSSVFAGRLVNRAPLRASSEGVEPPLAAWSPKRAGTTRE